MTENKLIVWHLYHTYEIVRNSLEILFLPSWYIKNILRHLI